jgi:hypothetical protein
MIEGVDREELKQFSVATAKIYETLMKTRARPHPKLIFADSSGEDSGEDWFTTCYNFDCKTPESYTIFKMELERVFKACKIKIYQIQNDALTETNPTTGVTYSNYQLQVYLSVVEDLISQEATGT